MTSTTTTTRPNTTSANPNGGFSPGSLGDEVRPALCFLVNIDCWISYVILGIAALLVLLILWGCCRKSAAQQEAEKDQKARDEHAAFRGANNEYDKTIGMGSRTRSVDDPFLRERRDLHAIQPMPLSQPPPQYNAYAGASSYAAAAIAGAGVSPQARYVALEMQQTSLREAPLAMTDLPRRASVRLTPLDVDDDL